MQNIEAIIAYNLRRRVGTLVEEVGNFPIKLYTFVGEDGEMEDVDIVSLIDAMRDSLEGKHGAKLFGLDIGDIWVTHIDNEFSPFTFDINGQIYFCVQNTDPDVVQKFVEEY
ncbi:hypothetical protein phiAS5_ORF0044 [Aeromonas phage phiAS5]|uniref:Uncharacterized protein n=1 Tax=Aeromonas phage phiAS5 TaxID=879630 RepID=E1A2E1_9CAUD|nr:hypothetical protein phiAS5_ORF0044 [Aeromonas phage phiAS5]ADM79887.1 hypothetical protein phiAS5_ORF0044 [Aeromonas phage phiAS5]BES53344.1 hypothetical protein [Aeromonas phage phiWae14]